MKSPAEKLAAFEQLKSLLKNDSELGEASFAIILRRWLNAKNNAGNKTNQQIIGEHRFAAWRNNPHSLFYSKPGSLKLIEALQTIKPEKKANNKL